MMQHALSLRKYIRPADVGADSIRLRATIVAPTDSIGHLVYFATRPFYYSSYFLGTGVIMGVPSRFSSGVIPPP